MRKFSWSILSVFDLKDAFELAHKQELVKHLKNVIAHFKTFKDDTMSVKVVKTIFEAYDALLKRISLEFFADDFQKQLYWIHHEQREFKQIIFNVKNDLKILKKKVFASAFSQNNLLTRFDVAKRKKRFCHHFDIVVIIFDRAF